MPYYKPTTAKGRRRRAVIRKLYADRPSIPKGAGSGKRYGAHLTRRVVIRTRKH